MAKKRQAKKRAKRTPKAVSVQTSEVKTHTIARGDTIESIANQHHTTVVKLCKDNGIKNPNVLYIGRKLKI